MRLKVLGSAGAEFPGFHPPAFLIDGSILMDAGTIGAVLDEDAQWKIRHILLSHAHLDHIRGIPFLADNIIIKNKRHSVTVMSIAPVLRTLKQNLLNTKVWPDFTSIPSPRNGVLRLKEITEGRPETINGYSITAYRVHHAVPATGYLIEDKKGKRLLYTGDTGPTEKIWKHAGDRIDCLIVEVSFPNSMKKMAVMTGHLTAELMRKEIDKMNIMPDRILVTHPKPQYLRKIKQEISALGLPNLSVLSDGTCYEI